MYITQDSMIRMWMVCVKLRRPAFSLDVLKAIKVTKPVSDHIFILAYFMVQTQIDMNCSYQIILL